MDTKVKECFEIAVRLGREIAEAEEIVYQAGH